MGNESKGEVRKTLVGAIALALNLLYVRGGPGNTQNCNATDRLIVVGRFEAGRRHSDLSSH